MNLEVPNLILISHPHQNVLVEQPADNLCSFSTLSLMILDVHFIFEKSATVKVLVEINSLRSDWTRGLDGIPVKIIKMVADQIASPLTHILNNCISKQLFLSQWKIARICAITKFDSPITTLSCVYPSNFVKNIQTSCFSKNV